MMIKHSLAMGSSDLKVIGSRGSSFANRVEFALNLKSLDYELVQENLSNKSELLLKLNPVHKKVPVFIHGEITLCESLVILEYIDEVWSTIGPSILPSIPYQRANARFWASYLDHKWFPEVRKLLRSGEDKESKIAATEKIIEGLVLLEDVFVKSSKGKVFFGGDEMGYLDIVLGCFLGWLKVSEILGKVKLLDEVKTPGLVGWSSVFLSNGATKNVVPEPQELLGILKEIHVRVAAAAAAAK